VPSFRGDDACGGMQVRAELRLRVLRSLPPKHQRYLFEQARKLCRDFLRARRVASSEMTAEELLSEIWQKLLGALSIHDEETSELSSFDVNQARIDADAPERDGRVVWLIEQIGGSEAMAHRREDILRRRFGRGSAGTGRRMVQPVSDSDFAQIVADADTPDRLEAADRLRIWRGLLATADLSFPQGDDVSILLRLLAENPAILHSASGGQWPATAIVVELNDRFPPPSCTSDRVDNAKRRLLNWIKRLKRENGLDDVDLEGLFARVAHQQEGSDRAAPTKLYDYRHTQH
jgi:hypothetical protein